MRIIIVGANQLGEIIASYSIKDGHDIVVIDSDASAVNEITDKYDVNGVIGNPISKQTLLKAGADIAEILISVTPDEVLNIMCCYEAENLGTKHSVARTRSAELSNAEEADFIFKNFNTDMTINLEKNAADDIFRMVSFPEVVKYETFFNNQVELAEICVTEALNNVCLKDIYNLFHEKILICIVKRDDKIFVPYGGFVLKTNDYITITAPHNTITSFLKKIGIENKPIKKVLLIGCGKTGRYLTESLLEKNISTTIIESDKENCNQLLNDFPKARIILGKGAEADLLLNEGITKVDACISLTDSDETNMVVSLFAWSNGVKNIFTRITNASLLPILKSIKIDYTVSPYLITAMHIIRYIRSVSNASNSLSKLKKLYFFYDEKVQALEFIVDENFIKKGIKLSSPNFKIKKNTIIASIMRNHGVIYPNGESSLEPNDTVLVITTNHSIKELIDIFS